MWLEAWVDHPGSSGCYTYRIPTDVEVQLGDVLTVPFGSQQVGAVAVRLLETPPAQLDPDGIRVITEVVDSGLLPPEFWPLLEQVSAYYLTPLAQVIRTVLPPGLLNRTQRRIRLVQPELGEATEGVGEPSFRTAAARSLYTLLQQKKGDLSWQYLRRQVYQAAQGLRELQKLRWVESYWQERRGPKPKRQQVVIDCSDPLGSLTEVSPLSEVQKQVLVTLKRLGGEVLVTELVSQARTSASTIQTLARKGVVQICERQQWRNPAHPDVQRDQPKRLSSEQQVALDRILKLLTPEQPLPQEPPPPRDRDWANSNLPALEPAALDSSEPLNREPRILLLQGVTGSGKTEVYLQAIAQVLHQQQSALVLVPEIGLTPQLTDRFRARFGDNVRVYHSGLSDGERYDAWRQMILATSQVVIGTRSAIFAPLSNLGLIVLDEEHDDSYKQDQPQPCYHARTVASWRASWVGCPVVLGTATPALETYAEVQAGRIQQVGLTQRINPQPLPPIQILDLRAELKRGNRSIFSSALQEALQRLHPGQEQAILFMPRRGYSTFVSCRSCGEPLRCPHCSVTLTFHQVGQQLRCHYCGHRADLPPQCPQCQSPYLKHFGSGTQKVVETLEADFPHLRVLRFDRDTTQRKGSHRELLDSFRLGEADVLVGTQMLTKGLDVPQVTLVGVIAADGLLNLADFRAVERSFQMLTQVAGRAGRGERPGQVMIQTYLPEHPTLKSVQDYDFETFVHTELAERQAAGFPPSQSLILLRFSSAQLEGLAEFGDHLALQLSALPVEQLGPCPAQVERISGWYRWQLLLKLPPVPMPNTPDPLRRQLGDLLEDLARHVPSSIRLSLDVDPVHIL